MDKTEMTELLKKVADGIVSPEEAALKLKMQPFMEIGEFAKVDVHRGIRQGVPEGCAASYSSAYFHTLVSPKAAAAIRTTAYIPMHIQYTWEFFFFLLAI